MAKTDVMIDLETLATSPDAAILTIGAVKFDPFGRELSDPEMDSFYVRVDLDSCDELGLAVNDDTVAWWANQSAEAKYEAFDNPDRMHIREAFDKLYKFCWGAQRVWSNGSGFDIVICEVIYKRLQKAVPWQFWQTRDCRTAYDLGINPKKPKETAHNALADAYEQAICIQNVYNTLRTSTTAEGAYITPFIKTK